MSHPNNGNVKISSCRAGSSEIDGRVFMVNRAQSSRDVDVVSVVSVVHLSRDPYTYAFDSIIIIA